MVYYCNHPYTDLANTQQMDYQLVDNNSNDQIPSSCSSSSPKNFNLNEQICNNKKPNECWGEVNNQDQSNMLSFDPQSQNTIEGFLVKAGGINPQPLMAANPTVVVSQQDDWCKLQVMQQQQVTMAVPIRNDLVVSQFQVCQNNNNDFGIMSSLMVPMTNNCLKNRVDRKVICSSFKEEMMEKTVERRRKRMIKNRESAARSRARKQAHTNQLELEIMALKKTNHRLKRYKEAVKHLTEHSTIKPRYQLRRTSSTAF